MRMSNTELVGIGIISFFNAEGAEGNAEVRGGFLGKISRNFNVIENDIMRNLILYNQDFWQWTKQQAECLRQGKWAELDVENLVEELETLGRSEQKEIGSYLQVLLMHLLKCQYQPERRSKSWDNTISNCRDKIQDCLEDTPSLQRFIIDSEWVKKYYRRAIRDAAKETQKPLETFPIECPYTIAQILDPNFTI